MVSKSENLDTNLRHSVEHCPAWVMKSIEFIQTIYEARTLAAMARMYPDASIRHLQRVSKHDHLPAMVIGKKMRIKGPRNLSLSLAIATTTVKTTAGTYGGTRRRS